MGEGLNKLFDNKFFIIFSLFLLFGALSVFAGNIFVNENGIQSDNYYSSDGDEGITQNLYCAGIDGQNYTILVRNGLIINFTQGVIEYNESQGGSSFPSDDLISYYKFDESSGTTANDELSTNDGTIDGVMVNQAGKINTAYDFDGSNDEIRISDGASLDITGAYTLSVWVYFDTFTGATIIEKGATGGEYPHYGLTAGGGALAFYSGSGGNTYIVMDSNLNTGQWYHLVGVHEGTGSNQAKIYVNGVLNKTGTLSTFPTDSATVLGIGSWRAGESTSYNYMNGKIDEIGIWDRALNSTEIETLYNGGDGLSYN